MSEGRESITERAARRATRKALQEEIRRAYIEGAERSASLAGARVGSAAKDSVIRALQASLREQGLELEGARRELETTQKAVMLTGSGVNDLGKTIEKLTEQRDVARELADALKTKCLEIEKERDAARSERDFFDSERAKEADEVEKLLKERDEARAQALKSTEDVVLARATAKGLREALLRARKAISYAIGYTHNLGPLNGAPAFLLDEGSCGAQGARARRRPGVPEVISPAELDAIKARAESVAGAVSALLLREATPGRGARASGFVRTVADAGPLSWGGE